MSSRDEKEESRGFTWVAKRSSLFPLLVSQSHVRRKKPSLHMVKRRAGWLRLPPVCLEIQIPIFSRSLSVLGEDRKNDRNLVRFKTGDAAKIRGSAKKQRKNCIAVTKQIFFHDMHGRGGGKRKMEQEIKDPFSITPDTLRDLSACFPL